MSKLVDLTGKRFGRLEVIERGPNLNGRTAWRCRCDCGNEKVVDSASLKDGKTRSCGCLHLDARHRRTDYHGMSGTKLHDTWNNMRSRCKHGKYYHERGIKVCERWLGENGFQNFKTDVGEPPSPAHSIDRINVNGDYEPGNVRWVLHDQQMRNTTRNVFIEYNDERLTLSQWSRRTGLSSAVIKWRIDHGWSLERVFNVVDGRGDNCKKTRKNGKPKRSGTVEYITYMSMLARCNKPSNPMYRRYGGRGIKVCERWLGKNGFDNFLNDLGRRPEGKYSLDRINVNDDYTPENCRWADIRTQENNRQNNVYITAFGVTMTATQWGNVLGYKSSVFRTRAKEHPDWPTPRMLWPGKLWPYPLYDELTRIDRGEWLAEILRRKGRL